MERKTVLTYTLYGTGSGGHLAGILADLTPHGTTEFDMFEDISLKRYKTKRGYDVFVFSFKGIHHVLCPMNSEIGKKNPTTSTIQSMYFRFVQMIETNNRNFYTKVHDETSTKRSASQFSQFSQDSLPPEQQDAWTVHKALFESRYSALCEKYLPVEVTTLQIRGVMIEDAKFTDVLTGREKAYIEKKEGNYRIKSFLVFRRSKSDPLLFKYSMFQLKQLCMSRLDMRYIARSILPTSNKCVLFSVIEEHQDKQVLVKGIRATNVYDPSTPFGIYMCGVGFGGILQSYTEKKIVQMYNAHDGLPRDVTFKLYAVPESVASWAGMGFVQTGVIDDEMHLMFKNISVSNSQSARKRKAS